MLRRQPSLEEKYTAEEGPIFCSGAQAIVRLLLSQKYVDMAAGLKTAGFVSGYRGSPLGGLDQQLWKTEKFLKKSSITFQPGVNEDLAATAVWGTQQLQNFAGPCYDGVFALWYGKGPGVDRSCDALKHGNMAGTMPQGGVLVLAGDDHACKSSSLPHQSDQALMASGLPILAPSTVQEIHDFGLFGWALSRYSGCWVGMKLVSDTVETSSSMFLNLGREPFIYPEGIKLPEGGLNINRYRQPAELEAILIDYKLPAAQAFVRVNKFDKWIVGSPGKQARVGLVTSGKSYHDVVQALGMLGFSLENLENCGVRLLKLGMIWPLDSKIILDFAEGLDELIVVEEKRAFIEDQIKTLLYGSPVSKRPVVSGKNDPNGRSLLSKIFELSVMDIAQVLHSRFTVHNLAKGMPDFLSERDVGAEKRSTDLTRRPYYCSGCPHNSSTLTLPEGSKAMAGIGCHYMAQWMTSFTLPSSHMGGEGVAWVGAAPFCQEKHVFVNLGDGTYFHSGILAIRQAVAAGINITYKILCNDAVAMTGGQPVDGVLAVDSIARQVAAEGVKSIAIVKDTGHPYHGMLDFPGHVTFHHRKDLNKVQETFKETQGTTVIIYDQVCAAEKRRRRKRGLEEEPSRRVVINENVCEGCGDCGKKSNCIAILPKETDFGTKREIDQSSCNKDYSCIEGFCPSFVTVEGSLRKDDENTLDGWLKEAIKDVAVPKVFDSGSSVYTILVAGVGGTGMVTIGALLGTAAHVEGKVASVMDQTGLSQKAGSVYSHIKISSKAESLPAYKVAPGEVDLLVGCDVITANQPWSLASLKPGESFVVLNDHEFVHPNFTSDPDFKLPAKDAVESIKNVVGDRMSLVDAQGICQRALGDSIYANIFMIGYVCQQGRLPISIESLMKTIELNNVAVKANKAAFSLGRLCCEDVQKVYDYLGLSEKVENTIEQSLDLEKLIKHRKDHLCSYQNSAYAKKYEEHVRQVEAVEKRLKGCDLRLTKAVAENYSKLLAYKDEYEVARLYDDGEFRKKLDGMFEPGYKVNFHLAPPIMTALGTDGKPKKRRYGSWMIRVFGVLAKLKFLRGTWLDPFGYLSERRQERQLIKKYEHLMELVCRTVSERTYALAEDLLTWPEKVRGFGYVKEDNIHKVLKTLEAKEKDYQLSLCKG